jgi:hypothetical protein
MSRMGYHWTPCDRGGGGGGGAAALVVLAVIVIAAIARPVAQAADAVLRVLADALEVAAIVLASAAGLAVLAGMAYGALTVYRWHARNRQAMSRHAPAVLSRSQAIPAPRRRAIEAPRNPHDRPARLTHHVVTRGDTDGHRY